MSNRNSNRFQVNLNGAPDEWEIFSCVYEFEFLKIFRIFLYQFMGIIQLIYAWTNVKQAHLLPIAMADCKWSDAILLRIENERNKKKSKRKTNIEIGDSGAGAVAALLQHWTI